MKLLLDHTIIQSWALVGGFIPSDGQMVIDVDNIPVEVQNDVPQKWCYTTENGYFLNPDYQPTPEPYDETLEAQEMMLDHEFRISLLELNA